MPKAAKFPNNHSALNNANFVTQAVEELLNTGRIKEVKNQPYVVNPHSVSENVSQKLQLIHDLWYVNKHVLKEKIKFDDWKIMKDFLESTELLFKFDIIQGYRHIDIDERHQKYLVLMGNQRANQVFRFHSATLWSHLSTFSVS